MHESVRNFFRKDNGIIELWPNLGANFESLSHSALTWYCWSYLGVNAQSAFSLSSSLNPWARVLRLRRSFSFLAYTVQHILFHADAAGRQVSQNTFLNHFNFDL